MSTVTDDVGSSLGNPGEASGGGLDSAHANYIKDSMLRGTKANAPSPASNLLKVRCI